MVTSSVTTEYAEAIRDSKNKPRSRGGPVAHVGYPEETGVGAGLAVLGIGEEESDDSLYVRKSTPPTHFSSGHLEWRCRVDGPSVPEPIPVKALIDNGSHAVLIDEELVGKLGLRKRPLPVPQWVRLAMGDEDVVFSEWVKLRTSSEDL